MKKEVILSLILLLILSVYADEGGTEDPFASSDVGYGSSSTYTNPNADYNNPSIDWNQFRQDMVPEGRTGEIPDNRVDVTSVSYPNRLTTSQLTYNDNLGRISDLAKLNQDTLKQSMQEKFGITIPMLQSISNLQMSNGQLQQLNLVYANDNDVLEVQNPLSTTTDDKLIKLEGDANSKSIYTINGNVLRLDITNTDLTIGNELEDVVDFKINDTSKSATVEIEKLPDNTYKIKTYNIEGCFNGTEFKECVYGEHGEFDVDLVYGIYNAELDSPGIYSYLFKKLKASEKPDYFNGPLIREDKTFAQSFAVHRPANLNGMYSLVIDKPQHRVLFADYADSNADNSGYVSLLEHKLYLKGIASYLRYGFELGPSSAIDPHGKFIEVLVTDNSFHKTYEGRDNDNIAVVDLEYNNIFIEKLYLENTKVVCNSNFIAAVVKNGNYILEEVCDPSLSSDVDTQADFVDDNTPYILERYYSKFKEEQPYLVFENKMLIQPEQALSIARTEMVVDTAPLYNFIVNKVNDYRSFIVKKCAQLTSYMPILENES